MAALRWAATGGPAALSGRDVQLLPQRHELLARAGAHSAIEFLHWGGRLHQHAEHRSRGDVLSSVKPHALGKGGRFGSAA